MVVKKLVVIGTCLFLIWCLFQAGMQEWSMNTVIGVLFLAVFGGILVKKGLE